MKDSYTLLNMKTLEQKVTGCEFLSMMNGFSSYNQVKVKDCEQYKTKFSTPWGTYVYVIIPFGLTNARATF